MADSILDDYTLAQIDGMRARRAETWFVWLDAMYPDHVDAGFAPYHAEFWDWVWAIGPESRPSPFVAVWPRGFGKSTNAELACSALACRKARRYVLYVCETQEQADDHVQNVASLLESDTVAVAYPDAGARSIGKHGNPKGWRRNRLRTASGFTLDAIGLDTAARGVKMDEARPDLIVFDDLDGKLDTIAATEKKVTTLTHTLIPAGAPNVAVLAVQNLVISDGIFARLVDGRADFLADRVVSGPHPAVRNLVTERTPDGKTRIVSGEPTWPAIGLDQCQAMLDAMGVTAFLAEEQHDVSVPPGGLFDQVVFRHCAWADVPPLVDVVVAVDPAVTDTDQSDCHAIQADGIASDGTRQSATIYRLYSWEDRTSPEDAMRRALRKAVELNASAVVVETNQGGDTWQSVYDQAWAALVKDPDVPEIVAPKPAKDDDPAVPGTRKPRFVQVKAPSNTTKVSRAQQMLTDYERGQMVHVIGTHEVLERAERRFPKTKPLDLVDAAGWSRKHLRTGVPVVVPASVGRTSPVKDRG